MKEKRFWFNCVEQMVLNPLFLGFRSFRVEVFDNKSKSPYQIYEASFLVPEEIFQKLYDLFDGYETDLPMRIDFNMFNEECFPDIQKKYYGE